MNVTDIQNTIINATTESELVSSTATVFKSSIIFIFLFVLLIMLFMGMFIINRDKANFYAIFVLSWLIAGILLFFTFWYPIVPQFMSKVLGGLI